MLRDVAEKYYFQDYNCAETIILAASEYYQLDLDSKTLKAFAPFGGGLQSGRVCGAVCSAVGIVGVKFVESKAHDDRDKLRALTNALLDQLQEALNGLDCSVVRPQFYKPEKKCLDTVVTVADTLEKVLYDFEL